MMVCNPIVWKVVAAAAEFCLGTGRKVMFTTETQSCC